MEIVAPSGKEVFDMIDAALKFDPSATEGREGVYQFNLTGEETGTYQMIIEEDGARAVEGVHQDPNCTFTIDLDDYRLMVAGTLNPTGAFMSGKLKIKGNMGLALKLQTVLNSLTF
ncbi:MAG TPA: SCP2 sterol-binding domain-containing protein [Virgibacillus sp.]|nr:SCP2 sterol-binding domain-containing protein [Virgibacillus sp.]